ncbi:hypothetical protein G9A89_011858 [Geosiphon pyriformis]|nr:hypothetical protein G9A89_011858 [Geosiphon pyriformis]
MKAIKPKKSEASDTIVNSLAGPLSAEMLQATNIGHNRSWSSEMKSEESSISELSDMENLKNTVAEETSHVDSNASETDDMIDDTTSRKTRMRTYVLRQLPKAPSFMNTSNDDNKLMLLEPKFVGFNRLPSAELHVLKKWNFEPVKLFALNVELSAVSRKTNMEFESSEIADLVAAKWFVFMGKDSVYVTKVINDKQIWVSRDHHWALLYTLLVGTTVYNLSDLVDFYGEKTCFIGHNLGLYAHNRCAVVCFDNEAFKLAAINSVPVYKDVNLHWTGLSLACCTKCKQFGHISDVCSVGSNSGICFSSGASLLLSTKFLVMASNLFDNSGLANCLASLECFLELLSNQISDILKKLSLVNLLPMSLPPCAPLPLVAPPLDSALDSNMTVDGIVVPSFFSLLLVNKTTSKLSLSSSKVLTTKIGGLESKMMALEVSVSLVLMKLDSLCSGLGSLASHLSQWFDGVWVFTSDVDSGNLGFGVAIIMDISLACYVCKISKVPSQLIFVRLFFKNKLSVSILGLYAGVFLSVQFSQADEINSMISKAVNESSFVVLGGDFNKDGFHKCASFKKCFDFGLVNSLANSCGVAKTIDFLFISSNLVNAVVDCNVCDVGEFFDTDYWAVFVSVDLDELLDMQLNSFHKQVNKDQWKFDFKTNARMLSDEFATAVKHSDLDKWFKNFDSVFTKVFLKFHQLKLLVSKIIKVSCEGSGVNLNFIDSGADSNCIYSTLFGIRKSYHASKLAEFLAAKEANIKSAIDRKMESFKMNKSHTIRSVLECPFCKVVLNHLVVDNELILEPGSLLDYVFNEAFSGVMHSVEFNELLDVVSDLPDGKAAGLLGITNEL